MPILPCVWPTFCLDPGARVFLLNAKRSLVCVGRNQIVAAARLAQAHACAVPGQRLVFPADTLTGC